MNFSPFALRNDLYQFLEDYWWFTFKIQGNTDLPTKLTAFGNSEIPWHI